MKMAVECQEEMANRKNGASMSTSYVARTGFSIVGDLLNQDVLVLNAQELYCIAPHGMIKMSQL